MERRLAQGILMGLLWVCGASAAAGASSAEVALRWPAADLKTGQQIAVDLWVETGGAALGCYEADVRFDPQVLRLRGIRGGTANFFRRSPAVDPRSFDTGRVRLVAYQGESLTSFVGEGGVAAFLFEARRDGAVTASHLGLTDARVWDTSGLPISATLSPWYGDIITQVETEATPFSYALGPIFPNPFNASTAIRFTLPEDGPVRLDVYSVLGQRVDTLLDARMPAGVHTVRWDASALATGVYLLRLRAGGQIGIRKAVLLR